MTTRVMVITLVLVSGWAIAAGAIALGGTGAANSAQITGTDPGQSLAPVTIAASIPASLEVPEYDGVLEVGGTLTATSGTWSNDPAKLAYHWFTCTPLGFECPNIPGADGPTYIVQPQDVGSFIAVEVVATNPSGESPPADSDVFGPVPIAVPASQSGATVSGSASVGSTLTADPGTWSGDPTDYSYQWFHCDDGATDDACDVIANANDPTYTVTADDVGHNIVVGVNATNEGGNSDAARSAPTAAVTN
jgi:hypothetical protein